MSKQEALFQSLATSGAVLFIFVGVCHEFVGAQLFPWGPILMGPIIWHALGILAIVVGCLLVAGTLRVIWVPVVAIALISAAIGLAIGLFTAVVHREFHMFALATIIAAIGTAISYQKASRLALLRVNQ